MPIISKVGAQTVAAAFQLGLAERVYTFLRRRAQAGHVGGVFEYTPEDAGPEATATRLALIATGWTVVIDTTAKTVTIS